MDFELIEDRQGPEARAIGENLTAHRIGALGFEPVSQPICLVHRAPDGRLLAGLVGEVMLEWLYVEKFWVDDSLRGQGIGTRMLAAAEDAAKARGAVGVTLNTSSFQAPAFYRRHGYAELGRLEGRPAGHQRFWFGKRFDGKDPRTG
ncbi:GNAT family N-acetyltransferase [Pseudoroseomonas ludipueritiae]|uniref:GNAT family N-acetyltransferase n=1 Tax=Pseudoroseomonas ludipueritiae TaxID=198093 RepID=A0ABR7RBD4_9PROT|nr:GNAT family N-acetyltransferase [Pseudoroseomonas ludipueritiae]MBC9179154.1 GNAT family N-acetyltransferase [Pseudoroseomonas ludipueritiae]MCG7363118.1 GNAT family N-acetyltransferase [Roseomonas sp. ACRSG]